MRGARGRVRTQRAATKEQVTSTHMRENKSRGKSKIRGAGRLNADFTSSAGPEEGSKTY